MARLRSTKSGVVINIDDDYAARLGSEWEDQDQGASAPAEEPPEDDEGDGDAVATDEERGS